MDTSQDKINELKQRFSSINSSDSIYGVITDCVTEQGVNTLTQFIVEKFGENGLDHVVSIQGGWVSSKNTTIYCVG